MPQYISELSTISGNERKFQGFSDDDDAFNPEAHKGKVLVTTYHKAKGLEWDRVYLMSVNNYDFPSFQEGDQFKGEKWFIRGRVNLEAELISKLKTINQGQSSTKTNTQGSATMDGRIEYAAERLRLLYVGITRARESLIITWNTGKRKNCTMALALQALSQYWEGKSNASA
jgi:DNA helicase-2/ATP-dependent DNA helicase PcrA